METNTEWMERIYLNMVVTPTRQKAVAAELGASCVASSYTLRHLAAQPGHCNFAQNSGLDLDHNGAKGDPAGEIA